MRDYELTDESSDEMPVAANYSIAGGNATTKIPFPGFY
jgi:hypothetical protein